MPIETPSDLREHVELAIRIELSTIPPYLYAMYSLADRDSEAALLLRSIVAEEMLHAALASNLLLAIGGNPPFGSDRLIPRYPMILPHHIPPLRLDLAPFSIELVTSTLMIIERPELHSAPPEADDFETLGQFYHAVELAVEDLAERFDLFATPQTERQMADSSFYGPVAYDSEDSGGLLAVDDVSSAREAIEIIVHQGEGLSDHRWADPEHQELTHYYKLKQICEPGTTVGEVLPAITNPRARDLPPTLQPVFSLFDAAYRYAFLTLEQIFSGDGDKDAAVDRLFSVMTGVMPPLARYLMEFPVGDSQTAGPGFGIHQFGPDPNREFADLARAAVDQHPELAPAGESVGTIVSTTG